VVGVSGIAPTPWEGIRSVPYIGVNPEKDGGVGLLPRGATPAAFLQVLRRSTVMWREIQLYAPALLQLYFLILPCYRSAKSIE
jgi:hypothetical protein